MRKIKYVTLLSYGIYGIFVAYFMPFSVYFGLFEIQNLWLLILSTIMIAIAFFLISYKIALLETKAIKNRCIICWLPNKDYNFLYSTIGMSAFLILFSLLLFIPIMFILILTSPPITLHHLIPYLFICTLEAFFITLVTLFNSPNMMAFLEDCFFTPLSLYEFLKRKKEFVKYDNMRKIERFVGFNAPNYMLPLHFIKIYAENSIYTISPCDPENDKNCQKILDFLKSVLGEEKWNKLYSNIISVDWKSLKDMIEFYKYDDKYFRKVWRYFLYYLLGIIGITLLLVEQIKMNILSVILIDFIILGGPVIFIILLRYLPEIECRGPSRDSIKKSIEMIKVGIEKGEISQDSVPEWFKKYI